MAKSSINFAKATGHSEAHNFREEEREPHYLLPKEHRLANEYWRHEKSAHQLFDEELAKSTRKGGRVPKFENSHWEAVLNLNKEHSMEDVQRVAKHIEEQMNITCTAITIHRDEGVVNERGVVQYNLHAHLNFQTYKDNKQNWRLQHVKRKLPQLQTDVAKLMNMERGKEKSTAKRLDHRQYKAVAKEREATLAKEADLKAEIAKLRATLKEQGGKREDYAKLEQANRELKAQLKDKTLTIEDLEQKILSLESTVNGLESKNKHLEEELHQKQKKIDSRPNMSDLEQEAEEYLHKELGIRHKRGKFTLVGAFKYLVGKVKELMTENKQLKQENEVLARAKQEHVDNTNLDDLLEELQEHTRKFEEGVRVNEIPKFTEEDWRDQLNEVPELPKSRRYK